MSNVARFSNVFYLSDYREPAPGDDPDSVLWLEDYKDLWVAVLRRAMEDYWQGLRSKQPLNLGADGEAIDPDKDPKGFRQWLDAAHWLLSDDTAPRSCLWLLKCIRLEREEVLKRMKRPPPGQGDDRA